jgi:PAS domain S-box-containing protein
LPLLPPEEASVELIRLIHESTSTEELLHSAVSFFKKQSGCEAAGIRLQEGHDYPYAETSGFPGTFVQLENSLCAKHPDGELIQDAHGRPVVECMCGNVIRGRFDASKPFFTHAGSFWTNSTTELLAITGEADRQGRTCNRCNRAGYESVALIPLRMGRERLGLVQLNDPRKCLFSVELVHLWESLADYLAVGLTKHRADEALRENERRYRTLFESANDMVSIHDLGGRFLEINQVGSELLGYSHEEFLCLRVTELSAPEAAERFRRDLEKVREYGRAVFETTLHDKAGQSIPVEVSSRLMDYDGREAMLSITRDLRERRLAAVALRESKERYRALFDAMLEGFAYCRMLYDDQGRPEDWVYLDVNRAFYDVTGLAEIVGKRATEAFPGIKETSPELLDLCGRVASTGRPERFEIDFAPLSKRLDVAVSSPEVGRFAVVFTDVTERRAIEEQFRQAQKMEALGRLAGGIAHDFNNLLNVIIGYSELILRGDEDVIREPVRADLHEIKNAAERAASLSRQILAFSRRQVLCPQVVSLNEVLSGLEPLLRRTLGEDVNLAFSLSTALGQCEVDPTQIEQVLMNLAVNARDAMPIGGSLTVETSNVYLTRAYARTHPEISPGPYVMLAVSDTGSGIDPETLKHIFEPFFTTKEEDRGTGLGLSTVFGIVKQSGGSISVYSEPGKGTAFKIYFPEASIPDALREAEALSGEQRPGGSETILVVEDEPSLRSLVARALAEAGYRVIEVGSAERALEALDAHSVIPDLLLTDLVLPDGQGGRELAGTLAGRIAGLKVIFTSGYSLNSIAHGGGLSPSAAFLEKPFTPEALLRRVREALDEPVR